MKSLLWLCRRGMKELDLMMLDYLHHDYPHATEEQQSAFRQLLQHQDPYILDLLFERQKSEEAHLNQLIDYLRDKAINSKND